MAKLKVHGGSFKEGQGSYLWGNISLPKLGTLMGVESFSESKVVDVQIATEESIRKVGSTLGWAAAGAFLIGPFGLLAGVFGGKKKEVTFIAELDDGRGFVATSDLQTFAKLRSAAMKNGASGR